MARRRWTVLPAALLLLAGCTRGASDDGATRENLLTPRFAADTTTSIVTPTKRTATTAPSSAAGAPGGTPGTTAATTTTVQDGAPTVPGATTAAVVDRRGDLTLSADPPPAWADLVGGTLIRRADGFELRVRLGGGSAPTTTDEDHTMNVASFYDVNGDGDIDYEVWANLAAGGWGGSWFDNRRKTAGFMDKAGLSITVAGDEVVLRFPLSHLGGAERFRWALASEWGRYEVLGTAAMARDDAPDHDGAARFPG